MMSDALDRATARREGSLEDTLKLIDAGQQLMRGVQLDKAQVILLWDELQRLKRVESFVEEPVGP